MITTQGDPVSLSLYIFCWGAENSIDSVHRGIGKERDCWPRKREFREA